MKVINKDAFMETFQYFDKPVVLEIIDIFTNECEDRLANIKSDIDNQNFSALKFDAHSFKGVVSNFMADQTISIARELENRGAQGINEGLDELFHQLKASAADLLDDLKEVRKAFE